MKKIQRVSTPTGECLRIFDRHNQPFLLMPESKAHADCIQYFKAGAVMGGIGGLVGWFILSMFLNLFQPHYPVQPATYQQSPVDGVV